MAANEKRALSVLLLALLLDLLAFTLILPLFPSLLDHFARLQQEQPDPLFSALSSASHRLQSLLAVPSLDRYNNVFFGGILGSLFSFLQFLSSPMFGSLSDRHGRKPLLLLSVAGSLLAYWCWSLSGACFSLFFLSRLVGGLSKASVSLAIAVVTDLLPNERRGKGMAMVGAAFSLAFLLGPSIGAYMSIGARQSGQFDHWPPRLAMCLSALELIILLFWLPETLEKSKENAVKSSAPPAWTLISPRALFAFEFVKDEPGLTTEKSLRKMAAEMSPTNSQTEMPSAEEVPLTANTSPEESPEEKTAEMPSEISPEMSPEMPTISKSEAAAEAAPSCSRPLLRAYAIVYFLFLLFFSAMEFTLGFLTHLRFQYTSVQQGRLYLFSGLCMLIVQGFFVRRIASTPRAQSAGALFGLCSIVPAYLLMAVAHSRPLLYGGLFLYSLASATVVPFMTTLFSRHCDQAQRGVCLGAFRSIGSLARALGPFLGSFLFWLFGPTLSYGLGAVGLLLPILLFRGIRPSAEGEEEKKEEEKKPAAAKAKSQ